MQLGLAIGGAALGYATLGTALGAQLALGIGFTVGNLVYQAFLAPPVEGPRIKDPGQTDSAYGAPIPIVAGTAMVDRPTIIHCSDLIHVTQSSGGGLFGKGGGGVETDHVYKTFAFVVGVGQGGALDLLELWEANKKILDLKPGNTGPATAGLHYKWHDGTQEAADPWLEELEGAGNVPAYRGKAVLVIYRRELTKFGGVVPPYKMLVASAATPSYPWESLAYPIGCEKRTWLWAADFDRLAVYSVEHDLSATVKWLVKRDLLTGAILAYKAAPINDPPWNDDSGELRYGGLSVDLAGRIYGGTLSNFYRFDPWSLTPVISFGSYGFIGDRSAEVHDSPLHGPFLVRIRENGDFRVWNGETGAVMQTIIKGTDYTGTDVENSMLDHAGNLWLVGGATLRRFSLGGISGAVTAQVSTHDLSTYGSNFGTVCFEPVLNRLHIFAMTGGSAGRWVAFDIDTLAIVDGLATGLHNEGFTKPLPWMRESLVAYSIGIDKYTFDTATKIETLYDNVVYGFPGTTTGHQVFRDPWTGAIWCNTDATGVAAFRIWEPKLTGNSVTLRSLLEDTSARSGFAAADYDFTAQTQTVRGTAFYGKTGAERILQLRPGYQFDVISEDWQIKGRNRGGASVATVDELELGASDGDDFPDILAIDRVQDEHLPKAVEFYYISAERDYQETSEPARRAAAASAASDKIEIHFPGVMTADEALNAAHRYLWSIWRNRELYKAAALPRHLRYSAADLITVTRGGVSHVMRLTPKVAIGANGIVQLDAVAEDPAVYGYQFTGAGSSGDNYVPAEVSYAPPSEIAVIDGPLLTAADDGTLGYHVAVAARGASGGWEGARILKSSDGGASWNDVGTIDEQQSFGFAISVLGYAGLTPGNPTTMNGWDDVNTIDVSIINGLPPANKTDQQIYDFEELIAVGHPSRGWEIVQAGAKTLLSGSAYRYSHLLRGRFGSEQWADDHQAGDYVVHLSRFDVGNVLSIDAPAGELNVATLWRAESLGNSFPTMDAVSAVNIGTRLKPLAGYTPVRTDDSPGAGDVTVAWSPRSRMIGAIFNAPTGETSEVYRVDIFTTGDVFKRTVLSTDSAAGTYVDATAANAPKLKYKSADRTTDGLTGAASFKLNIYQVSPTLTALKPAGSTLDLGYPLIVTV